jgi:hypothetical protein
MIRANAFQTGDDEAGITVHFRLVDDVGVGISRVSIFDTAGVELDVPQPTGCPHIWEFDVGPIARGRLPLWVEAEDCARQITRREQNGPFFTMGPNLPGVPMPCAPELMCPPMTAACNTATSDILAAQAELQVVCERCARLRRAQEGALAEAIGFTIAAAVFAILAAFFAIIAFSGGFWGAIGFVLMLAAGAMMLYFAGEAARAYERERSLRLQAEACERRMRELRDAFDDALERIGESCCLPCVFAPLTAPC